MTKTQRGGLRVLALVLMGVVSAPAQTSPSRSPFGLAPLGVVPTTPWWKSELFKKELGLTVDQVTRIEKIWETTRTELRQEWRELSRLEAKLSKLLQNDADEAVLARQIDRVETARAAANKTRSLMLMQMLKTLTPDQRSRFNTLHDRWRQDVQKQTPPGEPRKRPEE